MLGFESENDVPRCACDNMEAGSADQDELKEISADSVISLFAGYGVVIGCASDGFITGCADDGAVKGVAGDSVVMGCADGSIIRECAGEVVLMVCAGDNVVIFVMNTTL